MLFGSYFQGQVLSVKVGSGGEKPVKFQILKNESFALVSAKVWGVGGFFYRAVVTTKTEIYFEKNSPKISGTSENIFV